MNRNVYFIFLDRIHMLENELFNVLFDLLYGTWDMHGWILSIIIIAVVDQLIDTGVWKHKYCPCQFRIDLNNFTF